MAARAIWKGNLKAGSSSLAVKLFSAVEDRAVHFHILDAAHTSPVKQQMVDPDSQEEVESDKIRKAYQVDPGTFVEIKPAELKKLEPKPSRDIEIRHFVPLDQVGVEWYERPYYLAPDGDDAGYFALAKALENQKVLGTAS